MKGRSGWIFFGARVVALWNRSDESTVSVETLTAVRKEKQEKNKLGMMSCNAFHVSLRWF